MILHLEHRVMVTILFSFHTPPEASHARPALSAPIRQRGIVTEVHAMQSGNHLPNPVLLPLRETWDTPLIQQLLESEPEQTPTVTSISVPPWQGGTMTRIGNHLHDLSLCNPSHRLQLLYIVVDLVGDKWKRA